jgi:hypothetical protein
MPIYCFETQDGEIYEREFPVCAKRPPWIIVNGKKAWRSYRAEQKSVPPTKGWPMTCVASGVHPDQAGELRKYLADRGVPTEVTPDGDPVYRNAAHRRKALKARGMFDKAGYN